VRRAPSRGEGVKNIDARKGYVWAANHLALEEDELLVTTKEGVMIEIPAGAGLGPPRACGS